MGLFSRSTPEITPEIQTKLNRLPEGILKNAMMMKEQGNDQAIKDLITVAQSDKLPEARGFFSKLWIVAESAFPHAALVAGGAGVISYAVGNTAYASSLGMGDPVAETIAENVAPKLGTTPGEVLAENGYHIQDLATRAAIRGGMLGGFTFALQSFMQLASGQLSEKIAQEDTIKQKLWNLMNNPEAAGAQYSSAAPQDSGMTQVSAPLPTPPMFSAERAADLARG